MFKKAQACCGASLYPVIAIAFLLLTGCGGHYEALSSGSIGCAPSAITIQDVRFQGKTTTWQATCAGKLFYCTQANDAAGQVACARSP